MNSLIFNIDELPKKELPILTDEEAGQKFKKWSFVNIYSLTALRDIYSLTKEIEKKTVNSITTSVNETRIKKDLEKKFTPFTERQVLENLNALVKFDLLHDDYRIKKNCFQNSAINSELSNNDIETLKNIYFNYFRFKELSSWFIDPSPKFHKEFENLTKQDFLNQANPLYFYSDECKFYNSFLRDIENPNTKYTLENDVVMRFWDVYIKWGTTLGVIDKFNISRIFKPIKNKEVSIAYFIKDFDSFNFETFIYENFNSRNIWIPELIYKIVVKFHFPVNEIKDFIVQNIMSNNKLTFERTSEIFLIKGKTSKKNIKEATYLYPLLDNYYISNLIIRK